MLAIKHTYAFYCVQKYEEYLALRVRRGYAVSSNF